MEKEDYNQARYHTLTLEKNHDHRPGPATRVQQTKNELTTSNSGATKKDPAPAAMTDYDTSILTHRG